MVRVRTETGGYFHEPPYTEDEELELYRRMTEGPFTVLHRPAPASTQQTAPLPSQAEDPSQ